MTIIHVLLVGMFDPFRLGNLVLVNRSVCYDCLPCVRQSWWSCILLLSLLLLLLLLCNVTSVAKVGAILFKGVLPLPV